MTVITGASAISSHVGAITAGGPICSASTYVAPSEIRIATMSAANSDRTRPRENPPRRPVRVSATGGGTILRPGWRSASVSAVVAAVRLGRQPLALMRHHEVVHVGVPGGLGAVGDAE